MSRDMRRLLSPPKPRMRRAGYVEKPTRGCSPSLPTSIPHSSWRATTWRTAASASRASAAGSIVSPRSSRTSRSRSAGGRGRLPVWVVRIRVSLRFMGGLGYTMRRLAARVHLWGGLLTGPFLLVLGLSGSVLVLGPEIEGALNAPPAVQSTGPPARSLDAVVVAALLAHPSAEPRALRLAARPDQPWHVELQVGGRPIDVEG